MKTTRKAEDDYQHEQSMTYSDFPLDGEKVARIKEWDSGDGFDIYFGGDKVELTNQEITVLQILFAQTRLIK